MPFSSLTPALFFVILGVLFCSSNATVTQFSANETYQSFQFFVEPFSTGEVQFGNVGDYTSDQLEMIVSLKYCLTWLIPFQKETGECVAVFPVETKEDTIKNFTMPVKFGVNFLQVFLEFREKEGSTLDIFVDTQDCESTSVNEGNITAQGYGGKNCAQRVIQVDDSNQITVSNSTKEDPILILFQRTPSYLNDMEKAYVETANIYLKAEDQAGFFLESSNYNEQYPLNYCCSTNLEYNWESPSFSLTENSGQYWIVTPFSSSNAAEAGPIEISINYTFCEESSNDEHPMGDDCKILPTELDYSSMMPNVPVKYSLPTNSMVYQKFFAIQNTSNLKLALWMPNLRGSDSIEWIAFDNVDGLPNRNRYPAFDNVKIYQNYILIDQFGVTNWHTIFLQVYCTQPLSSCNEIYWWTFDDYDNMCPEDCNGICHPGETLCECSDGSYEMSCSVPPEDEGMAWWAWFLIGFVGAFVLGGVALGVFFYSKRSGYISVDGDPINNK